MMRCEWKEKDVCGAKFIFVSKYSTRNVPSEVEILNLSLRKPPQYSNLLEAYARLS